MLSRADIRTARINTEVGHNASSTADTAPGRTTVRKPGTTTVSTAEDIAGSQAMVTAVILDTSPRGTGEATSMRMKRRTTGVSTIAGTSDATSVVEAGSIGPGRFDGDGYGASRSGAGGARPASCAT